MKRPALDLSFFLTLLLTFLTATLSSDLSAAQSPTPPSEQALMVSSDYDYPPYEFNDARGNPTGFNIDLVRAAAEAVGLHADVTLGVWNEVRQKLEDGKIDVIAGMYYSREREKTVDFSVPHNMVSSALFVRNGSPIRTFEQAREREIVVQRGDIMHDYLVEQGFTTHIVTVNNPIEALQLLKSGKHDGVLLSSKIQGLYLLGRNGIQDVRVVETHLPARKYCFAVRKNDTAVLLKLNEGLNILKHTGRYQELYEKWFGVYKEKSLWQTSRFFIIAFIAILLLLAVISAITWVLRLQVKKRTRELLLSEERYRHMIQNARDILYVTNEQGHILYINPVAEFITGYGAGEMKERRFLDLIHPDFRDEMRATYECQCAEKTANTYHEFPIVTKDSRVVWIGQNTQLLESDGQALGFQAIARDITDRRQVEEELCKNRQFLSDLIEHSGTLIFVKDRDGCYEMVNRKWEDVTGLKRQLVLGKTDEDLFPGLIGRQFRLNDMEVMETGSVMEKEEILEDGHRRRFFISIKFPLYGDDGMVRGICGMTTEITERKRAEDSLRESEEQMRVLSENLADGMVYQINSGRDGQTRLFTYVSPALERLHHLKVEDVKRNPSMIYDQIDEDYRALVVEAEAKAFATMSKLDMDVPVRLPSGEVRWRRFTSSPRRHSDESIVWDGIELDITEQKLHERNRKELEERLQRAEKMEALGTLAGGVAHDLNNVLGILVGYSELLLYDLPALSPLRNHVQKIMDSGLRAAAIVQDLLTLARRGVHSESVFNLNSVIIDFQRTPEFDNLRSSHPHVRIQNRLATDLLNIKGSIPHISKSLMNLLSNAAEAMPEGGNVTIATVNRNLDRPIHGYDSVQEGDYVVLSIADTGKGISEADIKHIFEPFYTKKVMGKSGTGLGLAVVWGTVKDHNGYIDVQSEYGKGTTFTMYFPVTREETAPSHAAVPLSEYMGHEESILVVDDIKEQRELAAQMLSRLNYRVAAVSSGEEAVEYVGNHHADLIVLDMIMYPGMDGLDTYKRILEIHPNQKAIIVSGFSPTDRVKEAQSLGAGAYVKKPYVLEVLGLSVKKELKNRD